MFGVNITVKEGEYSHLYSGDVCHIYVSSVDEVERQGCCLTVFDEAMSKMFVKDSSGTKTKISVGVNIIKHH